MSISEAYTKWSATYDSERNLTRDLDGTITRQLLRGKQYRTILEAGCGTGKNTGYYASISQHVHALDFSKGMLTEAREKVQQHNVTFTTADLTGTWPIPDQAVDLVVCNLVLEHIKDLAFIFSEAARVLVEGSEFFICELHPFRQYMGKQAIFEHGDEAITIDAYVHHLSDFLHAAQSANLTLTHLNEWWHQEDAGKPPRLVSFLFSN